MARLPQIFMSHQRRARLAPVEEQPGAALPGALTQPGRLLGGEQLSCRTDGRAEGSVEVGAGVGPTPGEANGAGGDAQAGERLGERTTEGNRGVYVLRRLEGEQALFLLISLWESTEAIKKFAGSDIEVPRYHPKDQEFLLELEPVTHYVVMVGPHPVLNRRAFSS